MTDWVPLVAIPLLAALVVVVLCLAVLALRGRPPRRTWHTVTTEVIEAPDEPNIYLVLSLDLLDQLYQQTPGAAFTKTREEETETTAAGGARAIVKPSAS